MPEKSASQQTVLAHCPFCGGEAIVAPVQFAGTGFVVGCIHRTTRDPDLCPIDPQSTPFISAEAAAKAWNTRVP